MILWWVLFHMLLDLGFNSYFLFFLIWENKKIWSSWCSHYNYKSLGLVFFIVIHGIFYLFRFWIKYIITLPFQSFWIVLNTLGYIKSGLAFYLFFQLNYDLILSMHNRDDDNLYCNSPALLLIKNYFFMFSKFFQIYIKIHST